MRRFTPWVLLLSVALALASPSASHASALIAWSGKHVRFKVGDHNRAVLSYTTKSGLRRHVLIWGAINAKIPDPARGALASHHAVIVTRGREVKWQQEFS